MTVINPGAGTGPLTQGTAAGRPASPNPGQLYYATDTGEVSFGNAAGNAWQTLGQTSATSFKVAAGGLDVSTAGKGLSVAEGSNAKQGVSGAMVTGSVTVANTSVTASSRIVVTRAPGGTNPGAVYVSAITAGTSFVITSTNASDTGTVFYEIFEPG